jgi:hypothetical protein
MTKFHVGPQSLPVVVGVPVSGDGTSGGVSGPVDFGALVRQDVLSWTIVEGPYAGTIVSTPSSIEFTTLAENAPYVEMYPNIVFPDATKAVEYRMRVDIPEGLIFDSLFENVWHLELWARSVGTVYPDPHFSIGPGAEDVLAPFGLNNVAYTNGCQIGILGLAAPPGSFGFCSFRSVFGEDFSAEDSRNCVAFYEEAPTGNKSYNVKIRVVFDAEVLTRAWLVGDPEPTYWMNTGQSLPGFTVDNSVNVSFTGRIGGPSWSNWVTLHVYYYGDNNTLTDQVTSISNFEVWAV